MNSAIVSTLLYCFLLADFIQSAPTISPLTAAAERAKTLVEKILRDVPAAHAAAVTIEGLTPDSAHTARLQLMGASLGIPSAPVLKPPSERFTLDVCVSRMSAGSRLYQRLLGVLSERLSGLSDLQADLRDLQTHLSKMGEAAQLSVDELDPNQNQNQNQDQNQNQNQNQNQDQNQNQNQNQNQDLELDLASRLHGNYEQEVAAHLTLTQLRSFSHDLIRSLRAVASYRPRPAGAR